MGSHPYGDMAGGFAVIKDVPKTMVYDLARLRNLRGTTPVIPKRTLDRPPTAELRPNQKDEDSLPPYKILDPILQAYVEEDRSLEEIVEAGYDRAMVARVMAMVDGSEYKRRQAPIGIKITHRGLGRIGGCRSRTAIATPSRILKQSLLSPSRPGAPFPRRRTGPALDTREA